jgi:hypothetical protein
VYLGKDCRTRSDSGARSCSKLEHTSLQPNCGQTKILCNWRSFGAEEYSLVAPIKAMERAAASTAGSEREELKNILFSGDFQVTLVSPSQTSRFRAGCGATAAAPEPMHASDAGR